MTATALTAPPPQPALWSELHRAIALAHRTQGAAFIGSPSLRPAEKLAILTDEIGEAAQAILEDEDNLRAELVDVTVCAIGWGQILHWDDIRCVMDTHTLRYGDHAVDTPHMYDGQRLAHLLEAAGRVALAVTYLAIGSPQVWDCVLRAALQDVAAITCSWIETLDAERSLR